MIRRYHNNRVSKIAAPQSLCHTRQSRQTQQRAPLIHRIEIPRKAHPRAGHRDAGCGSAGLYSVSVPDATRTELEHSLGCTRRCSSIFQSRAKNRLQRARGYFFFILSFFLFQGKETGFRGWKELAQCDVRFLGFLSFYI